MGRRRTAAPVEEQPQAIQTATVALEQPQPVQAAQEAQQTAMEQPQPVQADQEAQQTVLEQSQTVKAAQEVQEQPQDIQVGVDLADPAVDRISAEIVVVSAAGGLNLRTGPGRNYPIAELLEDGTPLEVLELPHGAEVPGWALVHTGARTGWVDRRFIQELEEAKEE